MFLPAFSGLAATCCAAKAAAPDEMPTNRPSLLANSRLVRMASSLSTGRMVSTASRLKVLGTKPAPMPWILWGPDLPPERTGEVEGSTAMICTSGLSSLRRLPTPLTVPPVPTPAMKMSTAPSVSRQISSAVVR